MSRDFYPVWWAQHCARNLTWTPSATQQRGWDATPAVRSRTVGLCGTPEYGEVRRAGWLWAEEEGRAVDEAGLKPGAQPCPPRPGELSWHRAPGAQPEPRARGQLRL